MSLFRVLLVVLAAVAGCSPQNALIRQQAPLQISAHRGKHDVFQENSLDAIGAAFDAGAHLVEVDLQRTMDGVFALYHDRKINPERVDAPKVLAGKPATLLTYAQLREVTFKNRLPAKVARLEEAFEVLAERQTGMLQLDFKRAAPFHYALVCGMAERMGVSHRVVVQCPNPALIDAIDEACPNFAWLARLSHPEQVPDVTPYRPDYIQLDAEEITAAVANRVHDSGAKLLVRTAGTPGDTREEWQRLRSLGVDVIMTDFVDEAVQASVETGPALSD